MKLLGNRKLIGFLFTGILLLLGMAVVKGLNIPEGVYFQYVGGVTAAYGAFVTANVVKEKKSNGGEKQ